MKNLNHFLTAAACIATFVAKAQINQTPMTAGGRQIVNISNKPATVEGNMYTSDTFLPAKITGNTTTILVRYNAYSDYFEMSNPQEGTTKALPKQAGTDITLVGNGQEYTFVTYHKNDNEYTGYLSVISNNPKVKIYKRERVYLQEATKSDNGYQQAKPATYKRASDEFYAQVGSGPIQYFSNKKAFAKLLPEKSKQVTEYIKHNSIDLEKTEDLQKLADYTATLM